MLENPSTEYDSPWKDIIEHFFEDFMIFFFPKVHEEIDWTVKAEFLEQELQKVLRDAVTKTRRVDKLVKVWLKSGHEALLYIHIEVQSQRDSKFQERMFIYHYRLYDRYRAPITSLAILGDDVEVWRPRSFHYETPGSELSFCFSMVKLLDYQDKLAELENSRNPFAMVVKVHLKALETQKSPQERLKWKKTLFEALCEEQKYSEREMWGLCAFLDWVFTLPSELTLQFDDFVKDYEEAKKMRYVTTWERRWLKEGIQQGRQQGLQQGVQQGLQLGILQKSRDNITDILEIRFEHVPKMLVQKLQSIDNTLLLPKLLRQAVLVGSLKEFEQLIEKSV
ncbi:MAG: hypothetical protein VSS75_008260 [Candidatus Parabeggiatoa sp.]|nr:hypothetical protein [Candidatus Parabeggiatoa sp.]